MKLAVISFTKNGWKLSLQIKQELENSHMEIFLYAKMKAMESSITKYNQWQGRQEVKFLSSTDSLGKWTEEMFRSVEGIIFIGASGIAVRCIAPYLKGKQQDPAVIVVDEQGKFCVSLLSGHLGGANLLATTIANILHAIPVITTATDINGLFSVDTFAKKNGLFISNMQLAKEVSVALLNDEEVSLRCIGGDVNLNKELAWDVKKGIFEAGHIKGWGNSSQLTYIPISRGKDSSILQETMRKASVQILIGLPYRKIDFKDTLYLVPPVITLGIGCKKDSDMGKIKALVEEGIKELALTYGFMEQYLFPAIKQVASIHLKAKEEGILNYCEELGIPFITYSAKELSLAEGTFQSSRFVESVTGVDNVCERAAVLGSKQGKLIYRKKAKDGVTLAMAVEEWSVDFE